MSRPSAPMRVCRITVGTVLLLHRHVTVPSIGVTVLPMVVADAQIGVEPPLVPPPVVTYWLLPFTTMLFAL